MTADANLSSKAGSIAACPGCGTPHLGQPLYEIDQVPVHDVQILRNREAALTCARGDIRLVQCGGCGLIWNQTFDPGLLDYSLDYKSTQAFSPTLACKADNPWNSRKKLMRWPVMSSLSDRGFALTLSAGTPGCRHLGTAANE